MRRGSSGSSVAKAYNNTCVSASSGAVFTLRAGDTGNKCSGNNIQNNSLAASSSAPMWGWYTSGDDGNNVCDYQTYSPGAGGYGIIRETSNITTLVALRAAWAGYTHESNDANSTEA